MQSAWKIAKSMSRRLGLDVRRMPPGRLRQVDAFAAQQWLLRESGGAAVIFDIGANIGQTARVYRELFPSARIFSFEPFEEAYRQLAAAFAGDPQVQTHQLAIADCAQTRQLFVNAGSMTNSLLPTAAGAEQLAGDGGMHNVATAQVQTISIDEFCRTQGVDRIDILKMDIQGGELMALHGAAAMLDHRAIRLIFSEVLFAPLYEGQAYFDELAGFLRQRGYRLFGLYNPQHPADGPIAWADAVFVPD